MAYSRPSRAESGSFSFKTSKYPAPTLDDFICRIYLPYIKIRKRSWRIDERLARRHMSATFGDRPLGSISAHEVEVWLNSLLGAGYAIGTCNRVLAVFKTICSFAQIHGYLPRDKSPCAGVSSFKNPCSKERYLTRDEGIRLMATLERDGSLSALAIQLLLLTGARKNEILKARWENVCLEQRFISVPLSKSGRQRYIVLSDAAMAIIRKIPRRKDSPWLFEGHTPGKPMPDLYNYWKKLRQGLGLEDVRIHDLRHTFASILVNSGHTLYEVQRILGHCDPRTTMRYAHLGQDALMEAAEKAGRFFARESVAVKMENGKNATRPWV